jgi:hypothetical protein
MKKDTQRRAGVSKAPVLTVPIGEPRPQQQSAARPQEAVPSVTVSLSARYIDSRMKQFCLR